MDNVDELISEDIDELLKVITALKVKISLIRKWLQSKFDNVPEDISDVLSSCDDLCSIRLLNNVQFSLVEENANEPENVASSPISDFCANVRPVGDGNTFETAGSSPVKEEVFEEAVKNEFTADDNEDIDPLGGLSPSYSNNIENDLNNSFGGSDCSDGTDVKTLLPQNLKTLVIVLHDINESKKLNEVENGLTAVHVQKKSNESNFNSLSRVTTTSVAGDKTYYICDYCPLYYVKEIDLQDHLKESHKEKKLFHCPNERCGKSFLTTRSLGSHMKYHNDNKSFHCHHEGCGTSLSNKRTLRQHMRRYHTDYYNRVKHNNLFNKNEDCTEDKRIKDNKCRKCSKMFSTPEQLSDHISTPCHQNRRKLQNVSESPNLRDTNGSDHTILDAVTEKDNEKTQIDAIVCPTCKIACPTVEFLNEHIFNFCYKCKVCRKPFALKSVRDEHFCSRKGKGLFKKKSKYIKTIRIIKSLSCELCQTNYDVEKDLEDHMNEHKVKVITCAHNNGCKRRFIAQEEVDEHEKKIHCQSCRRYFPHLANFTVHNDKTHSGQAAMSVLEDLPRNTTHGNKSNKTCITDEYQCSKCMEMFRTLYFFKSHLERGCYECKFCKKIFINAGKLTSHITTFHTKQKHFLCNICGRTFRRKGELTRHTSSQHVTERETLKCVHCDKSFMSFVGYKNHMKIHEGVQRELCTLCGFDFANAHSLKCHINAIHKNHRPFPCHLCDKRFKTKPACSYHVKTHENPNSRKRGLNRNVDDFIAAAKRRNIKK